MSIEKELEVYEYVKNHADEYYSIIVKALNDGIKDENNRLREQKSKIEASVVLLLQTSKIDKIPVNQKSVLKEGLENCSFFNFDSAIKQL